jgi:hypothetical protein
VKFAGFPTQFPQTLMVCRFFVPERRYCTVNTSQRTTFGELEIFDGHTQDKYDPLEFVHEVYNMSMLHLH